MKLKMLGLLGALVMAAPVAASAAPANGLTAETGAPMIAATSAEADAAATPGVTAKIDKVWWRGGYGWRRGYGFRRFGYGYRRFGYGYGYGRPFFRRRFFY